MSSEPARNGCAFVPPWILASTLGLAIGPGLSTTLRYALKMGLYDAVDVVYLLPAQPPNPDVFNAGVAGLYFGGIVGLSISVMQAMFPEQFRRARRWIPFTGLGGVLFGILAIVILQFVSGYQHIIDPRGPTLSGTFQLAWAGTLLGALTGISLGLARQAMVRWKSPPTAKVICLSTVGGAILGSLLFIICQNLFLNAPLPPFINVTRIRQLGALFPALGGPVWDNVRPKSMNILVLSYGESLLVGLVLGTAQWLVLRRIYPRAGWWIPATALGELLGELGIITWYLQTASQVIELLHFVLPGVMVGILQWVVLRAWVRRAGWWIPVTAFALTLGPLLGQGAVWIPLVLNVRDGLGYVIIVMLFGPVIALLAGLIGGVIYGIITLNVFERLTRNPVPHTVPPLHRPPGQVL